MGLETIQHREGVPCGQVDELLGGIESIRQGIAQATPEERPGLIVALAARLAQLGAVLAVPTDRGNGGKVPGVDDRLLTMPEAAERLGITEHQAREMGRRGDLPVVTVGKRFVRVRVRTLEDWIRRREGAILSRAGER